jgi:hypothetical protein
VPRRIFAKLRPGEVLQFAVERLEDVPERLLRNCCNTGARNWDPRTIRANSARLSAAGDVLRECSFPDLLERLEIPISTAPERELLFADPMGELDAGQGNGRTPERLEACHLGAPAFDRSMILLNEIVKVLATPHVNVLPPRVFPSQKPKGHVALLKAIERDLAWPSR